jgi:hypothetical protein
MSIQPGANLYGIGIGTRPEAVEVPFLANRAPNPTDTLYPIGKRWIQIGIAEFVLLSFTSSSSGLSANWEEVAGNNLFPVTPFVVGPVGQAGYQTIQSAVNAANTAGGGIVVVQPGTYNENLTLFNAIHIMGLQFADAGGGVNINGTHIPPVSGGFAIQYVALNSPTAIFSSTAAGSAHLVLANAIVTITSGFTFNLPNWTGKLESFDVNAAVGTNDGYVNNVGGSQIAIFDSSVGSGSSNPLVCTGFFITNGTAIYCPINFQTGSSINCVYTTFGQSVFALNNSTGFFIFCDFAPATGQALGMSSTGSISLVDCVINSSNNPSITGSGAGTLTLGNITFQNNALVSGSLTLAYNPTTSGATTVHGNITLTTTGSGFVLPVGTASGGTPQIVNARVGSVTFTGVSIAGGATTTLVLTNSTITGSSTVIHYALVGATTGSALTIQSVTNSAGSSSIVVTNGNGLATNSANLTFNFIVLN